MSVQDHISQWLTESAAHLHLNSKPVLRIAATALAALLLLLITFNFLLPSAQVPKFSAYSPPDRIDYGLPVTKNPLSLPPQYHYSPPKDLLIPSSPDGGIAAESRIGKITILFNGKDPTLVRALQTHEDHNRKFGYPLLILRHGLLDGGNLNGIWNKPAYILAALLEESRKPENERLQWLFWHDADTVLLNPSIPIALFLPPLPANSHTLLLLTADPHGLNNGVFLLRVHPWSISLLTAVLAYPTYNPSAELQYRDQSALAIVLNSTSYFRRHWTVVPQRWFNAYAGELEDEYSHKFQVRRGDLLVHFAGCPPDERDTVMGKWLETAGAHLEEWEVPVERTSLPGEVKKFWEEQMVLQQKEGKDEEDTMMKAARMAAVVQGWMQEFGGGMGEEAQRGNETVGRLKKAIEEGEDRIALELVMGELTVDAQPLQKLADQSKAALTKQAHAVIVIAERFLLEHTTEAHKHEAQVVQSMLEKLRELLATEPDNVKLIRTCMEDLKLEANKYANMFPAT